MSLSSRVSAIIAYVVPVLGWLYVYLFQRKDEFAVYHLKQSIGLVIFVVGTFILWAVVAYVIAYLPYMAVFGLTLFTLVIAAYIFAFIVWIKGILNVLSSEMKPLPGIGERANRLPIA